MAPDFAFVIVTDSHVDVRPERQDGLWWHRPLYSRSAEMFQAAIGEINARKPDFVEWGNDWSAGRDVDRCTVHRF